MNSHTLFQARDISVQIEKGADAKVWSLLHETVWGTPRGIRYQKITSTESEEYFKDSWFLKLWKGDQLLGVAGMVHRRYLIEGFPLNTFYLRSFSFHPKYQVQLNPNTKNKKNKANNLLLKKIISRFFAEESYFQEQFPGEAILFYGYVIGNNERSARMSEDFGFQPFRNFRTLLFSRRNPKKPNNLKLLPYPTLENKPELLSHIQKQYQNHPFFRLDTDQNLQDLWVLYEGNQPVAGLKARKVGWQIRELPGLSGKIMMNILPKVPVLSRLFNPDAFYFLAIDSLFYVSDYEKMLTPLLESVCEKFQVNIAMMWLDEESEICHTINQNVTLGLLNALSRNTDLIHVIGKFINTPENVQQKVIQNPVYVQMDEVT